MDITATCLHYGISCYQGLNIVKNKNNGNPQAFRPDRHMTNFVLSSHHLDMPLFDFHELLGCMKHLIAIDEGWFPNCDEPGQIYTRFCHISTDKTLGVRTPSSTKLYAILNPTLLKNRNLTVKCSDHVHKNWPLGHGQFTVSGNLGPLVPYVSEAKRNGFDDVLWLLDDFV